MAKAAKRLESKIEALGVDVSERFDGVNWKLFSAADIPTRTKVRTELLGIRDDLLKIAAIEPKRAAQIWDEHVPGFVPRPAELPEKVEPAFNSIEPGRRRRRPGSEPFLDSSKAIGQEQEPTVSMTRSPGAAKPGSSQRKIEAETVVLDLEDPRAARTRMLLEGLEKQYLKADDKYHFRDRGREVAFEAKDKKLQTQHETPAVVASMIDLAEARGWSSLKLSGTTEFRREAWLQASVRDFEVSGYKPDRADKARLDELRAERVGPAAVNTISKQSAPGASDREPVPPAPDDAVAVNEPKIPLSSRQDQFVRVMEATMRHRGDPMEAIATAREMAMERLRSDRVHVGKLVEIGRAPHLDKPGEKPSPFVTLEDDKGQKSKIWGVDLPRAFEAAGVQPGEKVALAFRGRARVQVEVGVKNAAGEKIGTEKREVDRNTWEVVAFDKLRDGAKVAALKAVERLNEPSTLKVFDRNAPAAQTPRPAEPTRSRSRERTL